MQSFHTIAVIGGTGRAGSALTTSLLAHGYRVRLLARKPENVTLTHPALTIVAGDATDREAMLSLMEHCDAVISTIGQPKDEPLNAVASTLLVLEGMEWYGIRRYMTITGLTIDSPADRKSPATQALTDYMKTAFPVVVADKQRAFELLRESSVDWTQVRLPMIVSSEQRTTVITDLYDCPGEQVTTADIAAFLTEQLEGTDFIRLAPFLASGGL